jgi:MerR family transcriptional regulator, light-induced transcriptional regulator
MSSICRQYGTSGADATWAGSPMREGELDAPHGYRIGAVSRLTGVPADTLRVWERRYGVVTPGRMGSGSRLYGAEDVARLTLIKRLVDRGDAISRVAALGVDELRQRLRGDVMPRGDGAQVRPCRVVVLGGLLADRLSTTVAPTGGVEVVGAYHDLARLVEEAPALHPDLLVLEYPTLHAEQVGEVGALLAQSRSTRAIVVYSYASHVTLARLESRRVFPWRAPVDPAELLRWCAGTRDLGDLTRDPAPNEVDLGGPISPRRFTDAELARILARSTTVRCECPHHLAELVANLVAFETYSRECESRNAEDAALHAQLYATTAHCRALIETALGRVIAAEGIDP